MTADILIWAVTILCFVAGVVFLFVPPLPGTVVTYVGIIVGWFLIKAL